VELTPGQRVDVANAPFPYNKIGNRTSTFTASFVCEPSDGATVVTRAIEMTFPVPIRWVAEPLLRRRLQAAVDDEIDRAKQRLESARGPG
jgi:carbon monoxide dehydrogenase subunit G